MPAVRPIPILSDEQLRHLADRLLQERARTLRALGRARDGRSGADPGAGPGDVNRYADDLADAAASTMLEALHGAVAQRETQTLGEIDRALRRLYREPERFGLDEQTGRPIPFERLDIIPWARRVA